MRKSPEMGLFRLDPRADSGFISYFAGKLADAFTMGTDAVPQHFVLPDGAL